MVESLLSDTCADFGMQFSDAGLYTALNVNLLSRDIAARCSCGAQRRRPPIALSSDVNVRP